MEEAVGLVSTCGRELLRGWRQPIGPTVSFMIFAVSVRKILDQPSYKVHNMLQSRNIYQNICLKIHTKHIQMHQRVCSRELNCQGMKLVFQMYDACLLCYQRYSASVEKHAHARTRTHTHTYTHSHAHLVPEIWKRSKTEKPGKDVTLLKYHSMKCGEQKWCSTSS